MNTIEMTIQLATRVSLTPSKPFVIDTVKPVICE